MSSSHSPIGIDNASITTAPDTSVDGEPPSLDRQEAALTRILGHMTAPEFFGMFAYIRQPFELVIAAIRRLRDYRAAHPDEDADMLDFADANASTYDRLGLTVHIVEWQESHYKKINSDLVQRQLRPKISEFWDLKRYLSYADELEFYKLMVTKNGGTAALVRMLLCQLQVLYQEELDLEPLVLADMNLNIAPDDPFIFTYTPDTGPKRTTLLRGKAEIAYTFFAQESGSEFRQGQTAEEKEELLQINPLDLEELLEDPRYQGLYNDDCFLQFAVYDKPIPSKIPQTITQCLTVMQKTNKKKIAWCLTSGTEWVFGVILDGPSRTCYLTDIISIDGPSDLNNAFITLAYWGMTPCQEIIKLFSSN